MIGTLSEDAGQHQVVPSSSDGYLGRIMARSRTHICACHLDEFTFRFNRRRSRSRGTLFFRLVQPAVALDPAPSESLVTSARLP